MMPLRRLPLGLLLGALLLTAACRNKTRLFANYYLRYEEASGETFAEVAFRQGDTLPLAQPVTYNSVFFQGGAMEMRDLGQRGVVYRSQRNSPYPSEYEFRTKSDDGQTSLFKMKMPAITDFSVKDATVSRSRGLVLTWNGSPLGDKEQLILFFTGSDGRDVPGSINGPTNGTEVTIPAQGLAGLSTGPASLYLVRKRAERIRDKERDILSEMEYYTRKKNINVVE